MYVKDEILDERSFCFSQSCRILRLSNDELFVDGLAGEIVLQSATAIVLAEDLSRILEEPQTLERLMVFMPDIPLHLLSIAVYELVAVGAVQVSSERFEVKRQSNMLELALSRQTPHTQIDSIQRRLRESEVRIVVAAGLEVVAENITRLLALHGIFCNSQGVLNAAFTLHCYLAWNNVSSVMRIHDLSRQEAVFPIVIEQDYSTLRVGPLFSEVSDPCKDCLSRNAKDDRSHLPATNERNLQIAATVATVITAGLVNKALLYQRISKTYQFPSLTMSAQLWQRSVTCADHSPKTISQHQIHATAYEDCIQSRLYKVPDYEAANGVTTEWLSARLLYDSPSFKLPVQTVSLDLSVSDALNNVVCNGKAGTEWNYDSLAALLGFGVGIKARYSQDSKHWVPSAGNRSSTEMFVINKMIEGLPSGAYYYSRIEHSLREVVLDKNIEAHTFLSNCDGAAHASAYIVCVASPGRLGNKYQDFGLKLSLLDVGVVTTQLQVIANAIGSRLTPLKGWLPYKLGIYLGLQIEQEIPIQVFALATTSAHSRSAKYSECSIDSTKLRPNIPVSYQVDELVNSWMKTPKNTIVARFRHSDSDDRVIPQTLTIGQILKTRRSQRVFDLTPPSISLIRDVLSIALECLALDDVRVLVFVNRMEGLQPGIYDCRSKSRSLVFQTSPLLADEARTLFIGENYGEAPIIFLSVVDLLNVSDQPDTRYEHCLVRVGMVTHRLWLSLLALGLSGTTIAGLDSTPLLMRGVLRSAEICGAAFICGYPINNRKAHGDV